MMKAVFPGSFDPPTNGHLNIVKRASRIFDELEVVIAVNPQKEYFFAAEERFKLMSAMVNPYKNVKVHLWRKLIVEFAEMMDAKLIVRGVRALGDFDHEFELSMINKGLNPNIETILLPTDQKYFVLRSTAIKELALLDGDITSMVPPVVAEALRAKIKGNRKTESA